MRAVVQRVTMGSVSVDGNVISAINKGYVVLIGVGKEDNKSDGSYLAEKIANLRVFEDSEGKLNLSIKDVVGEILAVSQFTLYGDCRKGRRPGFTDASSPKEGEELFNHFTDELMGHGISVKKGKFQSHMVVEIINDGPVTILLDSKKIF